MKHEETKQEEMYLKEHQEYLPSPKGNTERVWFIVGKNPPVLLEEIVYEILKKEYLYVTNKDIDDEEIEWLYNREEQDSKRTVFYLVNRTMWDAYISVKTDFSKITGEKNGLRGRLKGAFLNNPPADYKELKREDGPSLGDCYDNILYMKAGHRASDELMEKLKTESVKITYDRLKQFLDKKKKQEYKERLDKYEEIVTLDFEDGTSREFEIIGFCEINGKEYVALAPDDDTDDVYIYGYRQVNDDEYDILDIDDDAEYEAARAKFEDMMNDPDEDQDD